MNQASFYKNKILSILLLSLLFGQILYASSPLKPVHPGTIAVPSKTITKDQKMVVLIHGLMRTELSMNQLRYFLERQGYQVYSYSYPSARGTIHEHALNLNLYVKTLIAKHPVNSIYFVTHSLGGIIARDALSLLPKQELKNIGGLIMLAPPSQGSALAKFSLKVFPLISYFIKPMSELSSDKTAKVHNIPIPPVKIGIIAGRFDAKVPPASARIEGQAEPIVVNSTHTFIMNNAQTKEMVLHFLEKGSLI